MTIRSLELTEPDLELSTYYSPVRVIMTGHMTSIQHGSTTVFLSREQAKQLHDALDAQFGFCD